MELTFSPSADVTCVLNALLDIYERRLSQAAKLSDNSESQRSSRTIKVDFSAIQLPSYFSQTDPAARLIANEQFIALEKAGVLKLVWLPGETGHLLQSATLKTENPDPKSAGAGATRAYVLLNRSAKTDQLTRLQSLLLAEKFRYNDDWRA